MRKKFIISLVAGTVLLLLVMMLVKMGVSGKIIFFFFPCYFMHDTLGRELTQILMFLQYPMYTFVVNLGKTNRYRILIAVALAVVHLTLFFGIITLLKEVKL